MVHAGCQASELQLHSTALTDLLDVHDTATRVQDTDHVCGLHALQPRLLTGRVGHEAPSGFAHVRQAVHIAGHRVDNGAELLVIQVGHTGVMDEQSVLVVDVFRAGRPVVGARDHSRIRPHLAVVHNRVLVVAVAAHIMRVHLHAVADQIVKFTAGGVHLFNDPDGADEKALVELYNGIAKVISSQR